MSIKLLPELAWLADLAIGQDWPQGDEDQLYELGEIWTIAARQLISLELIIDPSARGVLNSVGGLVADEFLAFTRRLRANLPAMAESAEQLGDLGRNTSLLVGYTKYMILVQLVWLAAEIAELAFWAPEVIPVLLTGVRAIVKMLLRRLVASIAGGAAYMVGMDMVVQAIQFLKGDRTEWDTSLTRQSAGGGALGGAFSGAFFGMGQALGPKFTGSFIGRGIIGGGASVVDTAVENKLHGGEEEYGSAVTSGAVDGLGESGGGRRAGAHNSGEIDPVDTPHFEVLSAGDFHFPEIPFSDGNETRGNEGSGAGTGGPGGRGVGTADRTLGLGLGPTGPNGSYGTGSDGAPRLGSGWVDTSSADAGTRGSATAGASRNAESAWAGSSPTLHRPLLGNTSGGWDSRGGTPGNETLRHATEAAGPTPRQRGSSQDGRNGTPIASERPAPGGGDDTSSPARPTTMSTAPLDVEAVTSTDAPTPPPHGLPGFESASDDHGGRGPIHAGPDGGMHGHMPPGPGLGGRDITAIETEGPVVGSGDASSSPAPPTTASGTQWDVDAVAPADGSAPRPDGRVGLDSMPGAPGNPTPSTAHLSPAAQDTGPGPSGAHVSQPLPAEPAGVPGTPLVPDLNTANSGLPGTAGPDIALLRNVVNLQLPKMKWFAMVDHEKVATEYSKLPPHMKRRDERATADAIAVRIITGGESAGLRGGAPPSDPVTSVTPVGESSGNTPMMPSVFDRAGEPRTELLPEPARADPALADDLTSGSHAERLVVQSTSASSDHPDAAPHIPQTTPRDPSDDASVLRDSLPPIEERDREADQATGGRSDLITNRSSDVSEVAMEPTDSIAAPTPVRAHTLAPLGDALPVPTMDADLVIHSPTRAESPVVIAVLAPDSTHSSEPEVEWAESAPAGYELRRDGDIPGDVAPDPARTTPAVPESAADTDRLADSAPDTRHSQPPLRRRDNLDRLHRMARFSGIPSRGLPGMAKLVEQLRKELLGGSGMQSPSIFSADDERSLTMLAVELEQNFHYMMATRDGEYSGYIMRIANAEILFTANLKNPTLGHSGLAEDKDPNAPKGTEAMSSSFNTGSFGHSSTVNEAPYSGGASASFGVDLGTGVADSLSAGGSVNVVRNAQHNATATAHFVESGHVSNHRTPTSWVAYDLNLSYRIRDDTKTAWKNTKLTPLETEEKVQLSLPDRFLGSPPQNLTAAGDMRVPETHTALALTRIPELYDEALRELRAAWPDELADRYLNIGSSVLDQLRQGIYNYHTNFERGMGDGYKIYLFAPDGRRNIASVQLNSKILSSDEVNQANEAEDAGLAPVEMFGDTPERDANIETVHTVLRATSASHNVSQAKAISAWAKLALLPSIGNGDKLGIGAKISGGVSKDSSQGNSGSYDGLKVTVYRNIGPTPFYAVPVEHNIDVQVREPREGASLGGEPAKRPVRGEASLTIPQADAHENGFPVDRTAIEKKAIEESASSDGKPIPKAPSYLSEGVGLSHVRIPEDTVKEIGDHIRGVLRGKEYLPDPDNEYAGVTHFSYAAETDAKIEAENTLKNWLLGMGDYMNAMMTDDGNTLRLVRKPGVKGTGVGWTEEYVNVTLKARFDVKNIKYQGATAEERIAILLMALRIAGQSGSGSKRVSAGGSFGLGYHALSNIGLDVGMSYSAGSSYGDVRVFNHPILFEPKGDPLKYKIGDLAFELTITEGITGVPGHRIGGEVVLENHEWNGKTADLLAANLPIHHDPAELSPGGKTPPEVFENSVLVHLNTNGVTSAVQSLLPADLQGPASATADAFRQLTQHETIAAQFPHMLQGEGHFDLDNGSAYGLLKNAYAVLSGTAEVKAATYLGATADEMVLAQIALLQSQAYSGQSENWQFGFGPMGATVGGPAGSATLNGSAGAGLSNTRGNAQSQTLAGGFEQIALAVGDAYLYAANTQMTFGVGWFKEGTLVRTTKGTGKTDLPLRQAVFIVPEQDALSFYADNKLPVPDDRIAVVVRRWLDETALKPSPLSSTLMARLLLRWSENPAGLPAGTDLEALAAIVKNRHDEERNRLLDRGMREWFNAAFPRQSVAPVELQLPPYLAAPYEPHRFIGPAAVSGVRYADGRTLWSTVRELVEETAPGLLSTSPLIKEVHGRRLGKVHGGLMTLETIFSNRSTILYMDLLDEGGIEIHLPHPKGVLYEDVVIRVSATLTGTPEAFQERTDAGLEFFLHGQNARTASESHSQGLNGSGKFSPGDPHANGAVSESASVSKRSEVGVNRTQYWESVFGDYERRADVRAGLRTRVEVRLQDIPKSDLYNSLMRAERWLNDRSTVVRFLDGGLNISIPLSMTKLVYRHSYTLPSSIPVDLPVAKHPLGFRLTGGRDRQIGSFRRRMFGYRSMVPGGHRDVFLSAATSQSMLTAQSVRSAAKDYLLSEGLAEPGSPLKRAKIVMDSEFTDLRVLGVFDGAGFGTYFKHITAVTANRQTSHGGSFRAELANSGNFPSSNDSYGEGGSITHPSSGDANAGHQAQPRTEGFAKEQKRVVHICVTGTFILRAELTRSHLTWRRNPTQLGTYQSQPFTGDFHILVNEDDYATMAENLQERRRENADTVRGWDHNPKSVQSFDLSDILINVAQDSRANADVASARVAREIGDRLRYGNEQLSGKPPKLQKPSKTRPKITDGRRLILDFDTDAVIGKAKATNVKLPVTAFEEPGRNVLAPDQSVLSANVIHLTSRVAKTLDAFVELRIIRDGKHERSWWFHPKGRIFAFDPESRTDEAALTADQARKAGILTPQAAEGARIWGLTPQEIGRLESTSYSQDLTLEQAVQNAVDQRRRRLKGISPELSQYLEDVYYTYADLSEDELLASSEAEHRQAGMVLRDLRRAALGELQPSVQDARELMATFKPVNRGSHWGRETADVAVDVSQDSLPGDSPAPSPAKGDDTSRAATYTDRYGNLLPLPGDPVAPYLPLGLRSFDFGKRSLRLSTAQRNQLHELAIRIREAIRHRNQQGLAQPTITISAGGNGSWWLGDSRSQRAEETGRARGEAVREYLRRELGTDAEQVRISLDNRARDLPERTTSEHLTDEARRRRAVVTVEFDRMPGEGAPQPPRLAGKALPQETTTLITGPKEPARPHRGGRVVLPSIPEEDGEDEQTHRHGQPAPTPAVPARPTPADPGLIERLPLVSEGASGHEEELGRGEPGPGDVKVPASLQGMAASPVEGCTPGSLPTESTTFETLFAAWEPSPGDSLPSEPLATPTQSTTDQMSSVRGSRIPGPFRWIGVDGRQVKIARPTWAVGQSVLGDQERVVARETIVDDQPAFTLEVPGDGDCLFTSVIVSAAWQRPDLDLRTLDVVSARQRVEQWFTGPAGAATKNELDFSDNVVDALLRELDAEQLRRLLGLDAYPNLTNRQISDIERNLMRPQYRDRLRSMMPQGADAALMSDFPIAAIQEIMPTFKPIRDAVPADRLTQSKVSIQMAIMREMIKDGLHRSPERASLWEGVVSSHAGILRELPTPEAAFSATMSQMVERAIRRTDLWTTPFYDRVPEIMAKALDLDITYFRDGRNGAIGIYPDAQGGRLYIHYNGMNHYSAVGFPGVPRHESRAAPATRSVSTRPMGDTVAAPPQADTLPREIADLLDRHHVGEEYRRRLGALSPQGRQLLLGLLSSVPAAATHSRHDQPTPASPVPLHASLGGPAATDLLVQLESADASASSPIRGKDYELND
ncbi:WXG100-like domain-containing protein [Actinacidiphila glaucinigra]|uniref:WXG100-like domain-containing protein n=1 Tax=Actinacidiphila glaucinigra TaxID=235986 RepID=UPI0035E136FF